MQCLIIPFYAAAFFLYAVAFVFRLTRWKTAETWSGLWALTANAFLVFVMVASSGHAPVFELFESFLLAALILACLGFCFSRPEDRLPDARMWVWVWVLVLMVCTLFAEMEPSPFVYDHGHLPIVLFHGFRIAVLSLMLYASCHFFQYRVARARGLSGREPFHLGRNFLLLAGTFFMAAEYTGILWCLQGWGDFWMWGAGFFQSTLIVLYFMLAFHVPGAGRCSKAVASVLGGMGGFVILSMMLIRGLI